MLLLPPSPRLASASPMICLVTRVYSTVIAYLSVLAFGFHQIGLDNIRMLVINIDNRTDMNVLAQTVKLINELVFRTDYATVLDLGIPSMENDYGFDLTDRALRYLYNQHARLPSTCEYVILTNADNFYSKSLGEKILPHMISKRDIIAWGFISHHYWSGLREIIENKKRFVPQIVDDGTQKCIKVALHPGSADLGAVAYRLEFLSKHNLQIRQPGQTYSFALDGKFVEAAARLTNASVLLRQILYMHQ